MARGPKSRKPPQVILYSVTLHTWEVWCQGRPLANGSVEALQSHYPDAEGPSANQHELEAADDH